MTGKTYSDGTLAVTLCYDGKTYSGGSCTEIRVTDESGAYRVIYLARRPEAVYVLHVYSAGVFLVSRWTRW